MNCTLFNNLTETEQKEITKELTAQEKFKKGSELYKTGFLGILVKGNAVIKRNNNIGCTLTVRSLNEGEIFGAVSLFGSWNEGLSNITAKSDCTLIYIDENTFKNILIKYPTVSFNYIEYLTERIRFLNKRIDAFSASSTEEQLYEFLLSFADIDGNVKLNFGMSELSRRLNVGRTSLYRDIESLSKKKLIIRNGNTFKIKLR